MAGPKLAASRQGIVNLTIKDRSALYAAYMPFIKNGALFIPTIKKYQLGDDVFMLLTLMEEAERIPVAGKVIWLTPPGAEGNRIAGIGVQFSDQDEGVVQKKIETYLAGALESDHATHTM
jgi:type IV pilus assembly protein PilZ